VRSLRIPNLYSVIIIGAFAAAYLVSKESFDPLWHHLGALGVVFIVTYLMFIAGMMGGGDSKLGSALALWVGIKGVVIYVFWMAVAGGLIGGLSLLIRKKKPFARPLPGSWMAAAQEGKNAIPYGVAISFGAWVAMWHTGFITHQLDELFKIIH
jgi:prepilin peptidase CpaA